VLVFYKDFINVWCTCDNRTRFKYIVDVGDRWFNAPTQETTAVFIPQLKRLMYPVR
jgi:hypothetical protein